MLMTLGLMLSTRAAFAAESTTASASSGLLTMLSGLAVVLAVIVCCTWLLRRFGAHPPLGSQPLKIVSAVSVGTRERLVVVEIADTWLVIGVAPGRVSPIHTLPKGESAALGTEARAFPAWLKQVMERSRAIH
jgi:flagellar protein FliO/FliZ